MTDRTYRIFVGLALLVGLFFDLSELIYLLVVMMFAEGVTNIRLPRVAATAGQYFSASDMSFAYVPEPKNAHFKYWAEAERVWRFVVGVLLLVTYYHYEQLWFFPWFMGFAIFGAGISGVCPVLLAIRRVGFR
jgi:uncharacterized membrane protein (DUF485 family)